MMIYIAYNHINIFAQGSMSAVVECLLALRDHIDSKIHDTKSPTKFGTQLRRWRLPEVENLEGTNGARVDQSAQVQNSLGSKSQRVSRSPITSGRVVTVTR